MTSGSRERLGLLVGLVFAFVLWPLPARATPPHRQEAYQGSGSPHRRANPRRSPHRRVQHTVRCTSQRFGCIGMRPEDYDKRVRIIWRPRRGYDRGCLRRLRAAGIRYRLLARVKGVQTPVEVLARRLGGVLYRKAWNNKRRFILDCRMVEVLAAAGPTLRKAGIASIYFTSTWRYTWVRNTHRLSQHAYGRAMDITAIDGAFGYASVIRHYERGVWGCGRRNRTPKGAAWRKLYCALRLQRFFHTIFTPEYNRDHRDHFHIEHPNLRVRLKPALRSRRRR